MIEPTPYPGINALLDELLTGIQQIFGKNLLAVYLHGSLVIGDFDLECSDLDLVVILTDTVNAGQFQTLNQMHESFLTTHPLWYGRLDIDYVSATAMQSFKTGYHPMAVITPGEDFQMKEMGIDWLLSWYPVREKGVTLFGIPPTQIIPSISKAEFIESVQAHVIGWREAVYHETQRFPQSYLVLLLCRALYTCQTGEQTSKQQAGQWAAQTFPEYAATIHDALKYRRPAAEAHADYNTRLPEIRRFYDFAVAALQINK